MERDAWNLKNSDLEAQIAELNSQREDLNKDLDALLERETKLEVEQYFAITSYSEVVPRSVIFRYIGFVSRVFVRKS